MTENEQRLRFMGEVEDIAVSVVALIESMCAICDAAGLDDMPYLVDIATAVVDHLEA